MWNLGSERAPRFSRHCRCVSARASWGGRRWWRQFKPAKLMGDRVERHVWAAALGLTQFSDCGAEPGCAFVTVHYRAGIGQS